MKYATKSRLPSKANPRFEDVVRGRIAYLKSVKGDTDGVYLNVARRFNKLATKKIVIQDLPYVLSRSVWIIEDHEKIVQGTGFFLQGQDFITCAHCVGDKPFVYNPLDLIKKYDAVVLARNEAIDLAIIRTVQPIGQLSFMTANFFGETQSEEDVLLIGYPVFAPGKEISIKHGKITSFAQKAGIRRFNISAGIIAGNSGRPVLDKQNRVIGVAVTGADREENADNTDEHGVIPVTALSYLSETVPS